MSLLHVLSGDYIYTPTSTAMMPGTLAIALYTTATMITVAPFFEIL